MSKDDSEIVGMCAQRLLVDIHTHVYLPRYAAFLRSRTSVPRIFTRNSLEGKSEERLLILDDEPSGGRPVGAQVSITSLTPAPASVTEADVDEIVLGQR